MYRYFTIQEWIFIGVAIIYLLYMIDDIRKKGWKSVNFITSIITFVLALCMAFVVAPSRIVGESMEPTLHNKDVVSINKFNRDYKVNDVVVAYSPLLKKCLVKRIVAVEGDVVSMTNGVLYVNGEVESGNYDTIATFESFDEVAVPEGCYYLMGDNRPNSLDSRRLGALEKKYIIGKVNIS